MSIRESERVTPHPPGRPRYPFLPHRKGQPYWLTDGYGYGTEVSALRWWWRRLAEKFASEGQGQ